MAQAVKIISFEQITHDVIKIVAEKPEYLLYQPGQAVDVSINKKGWEEKLCAFTFTSLQNEDNIEFTIKTYPSHHGVTEQLLGLSVGDELLIHDPFGDISYKGEGIFIAGGAGVTPFIAIFKQLEKENKVGGNKLIFANKTKGDIIQADKFIKLLGNNFINVLSAERLDHFEHGYITAELIKKHIKSENDYFYICGPEPMMQAVENHLSVLGITDSHIVKEAF